MPVPVPGRCEYAYEASSVTILIPECQVEKVSGAGNGTGAGTGTGTGGAGTGTQLPPPVPVPVPVPTWSEPGPAPVLVFLVRICSSYDWEPASACSAACLPSSVLPEKLHDSAAKFICRELARGRRIEDGKTVAGDLERARLGTRPSSTTTSRARRSRLRPRCTEARTV